MGTCALPLTFIPAAISGWCRAIASTPAALPADEIATGSPLFETVKTVVAIVSQEITRYSEPRQQGVLQTDTRE